MAQGEREIKELERMDMIAFTAPKSKKPDEIFGYKSRDLDDLIRLQEQVAAGEIILAPGHTGRLEQLMDSLRGQR